MAHFVERAVFDPGDWSRRTAIAWACVGDQQSLRSGIPAEHNVVGENLIDWHARLTFDMSGGRRRGALAARRNMKLCASRPRCLAGGRPLDGRVRRRDARCPGGCRREVRVLQMFSRPTRLLVDRRDRNPSMRICSSGPNRRGFRA